MVCVPEKSELYKPTDSESRFDVIHAIVRSLPLFTAFPFLVR
jgi:hypothetical protein